MFNNRGTVEENVGRIYCRIFSVIKKNEVISFSGKWMQPEIILSELSLSPKERHHISSYFWISGFI